MTRSNRAVSTPVDVALCLLLISASVLTLTMYIDADERGSEPGAADRTAETIAATTVSITYSLEPAVRADDTGAFADLAEYDAEALTRVAHGPAGGLLADAAVANLTVGDDRVSREGADFERGLEDAIRGTLPADANGVHVVAVWTPYAGSAIQGRATVGASPPADADVTAATLTVPSGAPAVGADAIDVAGVRDYDEVATVVARAVVDGYVPPEASQRSLESSGVDRALAVYRYERFAAATDGIDPDDVEDELDRSGGDAAAANAALIDALADTIADDLENRYDDPEAAARAISTGDVTLVVRRWTG